MKFRSFYKAPLLVSRTAKALRFGAFILTVSVLIVGSPEGNAMGIRASKVNPDRYFNDPQMVAFVTDVQDGSLSKVTAAIKAGIDVNAEGKQGFRPLFFIFPASDSRVAEALLAAGANPNVKLPAGATPLYYSVRLENSSFTKALLSAKANPNAIVEHNQPIIHEAIMAGNVEQLRLLAKAGADINVVWDTTPLMAAISASQYAMAVALLELGADTTWVSRGGLNEYDAPQGFCKRVSRMNVDNPSNKKHIAALFDAFAKRGVVLTCAKEVARFR